MIIIWKNIKSYRYNFYWVDYFNKSPRYYLRHVREETKRKYREKVKCSICLKTLDSDYKTNHRLKLHKNDSPVFTPILPEGQAKLQFCPKKPRLNLSESPTTNTYNPSESDLNTPRSVSANESILLMTSSIDLSPDKEATSTSSANLLNDENDQISDLTPPHEDSNSQLDPRRNEPIVSNVNENVHYH